MADFSELSIRGGIATSSDSDWDEARQAWNLAADQRPEAVALVESADDVSKVMRYAGENGLRVTGQGTGHGAVALGSLEGTILIKTERMREVVIEGESARVEAGAYAEHVAEAAIQKGMCSMPGTSPNVGIAGFTLGGGLSWLGRKYGWACNRVSAIEVVTADGEPRTVSADSDPDLFWALRGGGGDYAIVTALHLELLPIAEAYAGGILFPPELTADGLRAYRDWCAQVPEEVGSMVRILNLPPIPDIPEEIRGKKWFAITVVSIGTEDEGRERVAPLLEIGEPVMSTVGADSRPGPDPNRDGSRAPGSRPRPSPRDQGAAGRGASTPSTSPQGPSPTHRFCSLSFATSAERSRGPTRTGARSTSSTASSRCSRIGMLMDPAMKDPIEGQLDRLSDAMDPWAAEGGYYNYAERPCDVDAILPPETCRRLAQVKRSWDPDNLIRANHSVALATA